MSCTNGTDALPLLLMAWQIGFLSGKASLKVQGIPSAVYYQKPMHRQQAFQDMAYDDQDSPVTDRLVEVVLSLPFHPYMKEAEITFVTDSIRQYMSR